MNKKYEISTREKIFKYIFSLVVILFAVLIAIISIINGKDDSGLIISILLAVGALIVFFSARKSTFGISQKYNDENHFYNAVVEIKNDSRRFTFAIGLLCYFLAVLNYIGVISPSKTGHWVWLKNIIADNFGENGFVIFLIIIGTFMIILSLKKND